MIDHESQGQQIERIDSGLDQSGRPEKYVRGDLTEALKTETRSAHDALEDGSRVNQILGGKIERVRAADLESGKVSEAEFQRRQEQYREVYITALKSIYGFERAMEKALDEGPLGQQTWAALGLPQPTVKASELIGKDLAKLGHEPPAEEMRLPEISTIPEAIGALYVRAGSRMGGLIISKQAKLSLGVDEENGGRFFGLFGKQTAQIFTEFLRGADEFTSDPADVSAAVRSAENTFRAVGVWQNAIYQELLPELMPSSELNPLLKGLRAVKDWFVQE